MAITDSFNKVVEIARSLGHAELKQALIEFREELKALLEENRRLKEQNKVLLTRAAPEDPEAAAPPKRAVRYERGALWQVDTDGILRGPMCARCWEGKQELNRCMKQMQHFFMCSSCGTVVKLPGVKPA